MGKYIIDVKDGETLYKAVIAPDGEPYITPAMGNVYTAPDLEQVRKEAKEESYRIGYDEGREAGVQQGLSDAWEAARNISHMDSKTRDEVFGLVITSNIFDENTATEAIEKIRQYEQKQEEIQVGDEVNAPFGKAIVVNVDFNAEKIWFLYADGHSGFDFFKNTPTKTGRHFPEIAEVLAKMKQS